MQRMEWNQEFLRELSAGNFAKYPNEVMLKVIFGNYLEKPLRPSANWKVLDIGCAFGSNLIPFADLGCEVHGIDIHPEIAANASTMMNMRGYKEILFSEGTNQKVPYKDNFFDLILSINTLHYESSERNILNALSEFRRVLKVGGACYISTVGPDHEIYRRAELISDHINLIRNFGFRNGEELFFFDNERYLKHYLSQYFSDVETGKVTEKLMTLPLDFLIAVARKK